MRNLAFVAALAFAAPAWAGKDTKPVLTIESATVMRLLEEVGHAPELRKDDVGDPLIVATWENLRYIVLFYGCNAAKSCGTLQFRAYYTNVEVPLDQINEWNRASLLGRAYLDADRDPVIEHTIRLSGGVTLQHLRGERDWFVKAVDQFSDLVQNFAPLTP